MDIDYYRDGYYCALAERCTTIREAMSHFCIRCREGADVLANYAAEHEHDDEFKQELDTFSYHEKSLFLEILNETSFNMYKHYIKDMVEELVYTKLEERELLEQHEQAFWKNWYQFYAAEFEENLDNEL